MTVVLQFWIVFTTVICLHFVYFFLIFFALLELFVINKQQKNTPFFLPFLLDISSNHARLKRRSYFLSSPLSHFHSPSSYPTIYLSSLLPLFISLVPTLLFPFSSPLPREFLPLPFVCSYPTPLPSFLSYPFPLPHYFPPLLSPVPLPLPHEFTPFSSFISYPLPLPSFLPILPFPPFIPPSSSPSPFPPPHYIPPLLPP